MDKNSNKTLQKQFFFSVPDGLELTAPKTRMGEGHGWLINPFPPNFPVWVPIVSIVPAILFYSLMFMTTEISE
jgi:hypothetical protein